jgi:hypothetical protein
MWSSIWVWGMSVVINSERRGEDEGNHGNKVKGEDEDEGRETESRRTSSGGVKWQ